MKFVCKRAAIRRLLTVLLISAVSGCGIIPYRTARNEQNCSKPNTSARPCEDVQRASLFYSSQNDLPPAFVGLSLSGGGSRAANFSMGVMQNLDEMGILKHVTVISSTSGGGLAGAYYALNGSAMDWRTARLKMGTNFLARWVAKLLYPQNLLSVSLTDEDRSDLMADVFDDVLFDNATYVDLGKRWPAGPRFYANTTSIGPGTRFSITMDQFAAIDSRLDTYPISQAVMASAAFPGVFNDVTLKRYTPNKPPYVHLLDGGPSDNLGIESILSSAAQYQSARRISGKPTAPCFLILVDAYPSADADRLADSADPRGMFDHLVDSNFMDAFDALLTRRRLDTLQRFGLGPGVVTQRATASSYADAQAMDRGQQLTPKVNIVSFDYPIERDKRQIGATIPADMLKQFVQPGDLDKPPAGYFRCTAWHLDLSNVDDAADYVANPDGTVRRLPFLPPGPADSIRQRWWLGKLVSFIETNFHLTGPKNCTPKALQDALYAAARSVTRQDWNNTETACIWFERNGLQVEAACKRYPGANVDMDFEALKQCAGG